MADDQRNESIEAALAKLYASELGWRVADELVQVFGGRGYETADSLRARGDIPVPVEQVLRDMRVTRIFEGTSEIMRLSVAHEAVDQHLRVAGGLLVPGPARDKAKVALSAGRFYATWLPKLAVGKGEVPSSYEEFGELAERPRFVERHRGAGTVHLLRHGQVAGRARRQGDVPRAAGRHRCRAVRHHLHGGARPGGGRRHA